jgi:glycosyltransferase involved in cell wall biosynthesis
MESMPEASAVTERWIALLGRKDEPADGVTDYCGYLAQNLAMLGIELKAVRVEWAKDGWLRAIRYVWHSSKQWCGMWIVPQYTAMSWSRRGFPVGALICAAILRWRGVRLAMLFHEPSGVDGPRMVDRLRCAFQNWTVRTLHRLADKSIFTVPLESLPWLSSNDGRSAFIPLGPNIPESLANRIASQDLNGTVKTVVIFCVSESPYAEREISDIAAATRLAASGGGKLRVVFVGRGTVEAKSLIEEAFASSPVEATIHGICDAAEVTRIFSESDAMLAVRGKLYLRRGSALAGLACGLPIFGYAGGASGTFIEEAGIALVPFGDHQALGIALRHALTTPAVWQKMHEKNLHIQQKYFSWGVIAASYVDFFARRSV